MKGDSPTDGASARTCRGVIDPGRRPEPASTGEAEFALARRIVIGVLRGLPMLTLEDLARLGDDRMLCPVLSTISIRELRHGGAARLDVEMEIDELEFVDVVRRAIRENLADCSIKLVAQTLDLSQGQLRSWLADDGTTFAAIRADVRQQVAKDYLEQGMPPKDIATRIGYADVTKFIRAFRRWTGSTPEQYSGATRRAVIDPLRRPEILIRRVGRR